MARPPAFERRLLLIAAIVLFLLVWFTANVLVLGFAGILLAIFLRSLADFVSPYTKISCGWSDCRKRRTYRFRL